MSSIDQRIVEMQFDNRQFENGAQTTMKTLDSLKQKLNFGKSAKGLDELTKAGKRFSLDGLASSVDKIASKFSFMGVMGVTAMQRISNAAITTGKRIVSALTVDPIRSGLSEYETQIGAIQTILSNTRSKGTTLDQVNNALDELNKYADKTIYNFTEMTRNIGTFTAAGVDLTTSVSAIKGISNLAAVSGSTPTQAATAMYQLSQALAAGTIRLMDWNSLVNAGMGGDVLQEALKETARVHGIEIDKMIEKEGSFRETLQNGWLTSEVMLETLQKFTGDLSKEQILAMGYTEEQAAAIIALGQDANDAATKVKTFSQLVETLKEALGSGWTQTWEYIIGDFEEARELWTGVSNALGGIINNSAEARNSMFKAWKEAGGRADLIEGLTDIFGALWNIVTAVGDAMDDIFPPATVDTLLSISSGVKKFGDNLQRLFGIVGQGTSFTGEDVTTTETVGGVDFFGGNLSRGARNEAVKQLQQYLKDAGYDLGDSGVDGIFGPMTEAALKEFQESAGLVADGIYGESTHNALMEILGLGPKEITTVEKGTEVVNFFSDALQRVHNIAKGAFAGLHIIWQIFGFLFEVGKKVLYTFSPIGDMFATIAEAIGGFLVSIDKALSDGDIFKDWLKDIDSFLEPIHDAIAAACDAILGFLGLGDGVEDIDFDKVLSDLAGKVRGLFDSIKSWIKSIFGGEDKGALTDAVTDQLGIENLGESLDFSTAINTIKEKVSGFFETIKSWLSELGKSEGAETAKEVENSLAGVDVMAAALFVLTGILSAGVLNAIHQISSVARNAKKFVKSLRQVADGIKDGTLLGSQKDSIPEGILKVAAAIGILAAAVWALSNLNLAQLGTGLLGVAAVCGILVGTIAALKAVSKGFDGMGKILSTIIGLSIGIAIMAGVVYALGQLDIKQLGIGLAGAVAIMAVSIASIQLLSKNAKGSDNIEKMIGLVVSLAGAISAMSAVITTLGALDISTLLKGLSGLGAIMLMLSAMMKSMTKSKPNVSSILALIPIVVAIGLMIVGFAGLSLLMKALSASDLIKAFASLAAIVLAMGAILKFASKIKANPSAILSLIPITLALDLVIAGFIGLALTMKGLTTTDLMESIAGLAAVMLSIFGLMKLISGIKPSVGAILSLIPIALALDMVIAGFIGMALTMKGLTTADLIESVVGLGAVMLAIFALMKLVSKIKPSIGAIISLIPIAATLDLVIAGFISLALAMRSMSTGDLVKTIVGLASVMLAIFALMKLTSKIKPSVGSIVALIPISVALDLLIAGFIGLALTMRDSTAGDLAKTIVGLGAVMLAVFGLMKLVSKIKPSIGSILALLPVALALDLLIAGFIGLTLTMKSATVGTLLKAIVGLAAVVLAIFALTKLVSKINISPKAFMSLIPVAIALDLAVAGFIGLLLAMKGASAGAVIGTIAGLAVIIGALALLMKSLENVKPNIRAILALVPVVIAIDLLLLGFGTFVYALRNVHPGTIAAALLGFGAVMFAMSAFMKSVQNLNLKSSIASLVQCIGLIGIVASFAFALNSIQTVDTDKIVSFAGGLSAVLLSFGAFTKLAGSVGIAGVGTALLALLGIVAVIGLIVAAFGALSKIPGFQDFMNSGASSIGEMIGSFMGSMQAASMNAMSKGLSKLADTEIDEEGLNHVLEMAGLIQEFSEGLPEKGFMDQAADKIFGSELDQFSWDMVSFGTGLSIFAAMINAVTITEDLSAKTASAIAIANQILTFAQGIPEKTPAKTVVDSLFGSELDQFSGDMVAFGEGFTNFAAMMSAVTITEDLSSKTASAISIANQILAFSEGLPEKTPAETIVDWLFGSEIEQFSSDMVAFGEGFSAFATEMAKVTIAEDLSGKTTSAISIANQILTFSEGLPVKTPEQALTDWLFGTAMENFSGDMVAFGEGFNDFATEMAKVIITEDLSAKTASAISIANQILAFSIGLPVKTPGQALIDWLFGTTMANFTGDMNAFAEGFNDFATQMNAIKEIEGLDSKVTYAIGIANAIQALNDGLEGTYTDAERFLSFMDIFGSKEVTDMELFTGDMNTFATNFNKFTAAMEGVETSTELSAKVTDAIAIADEVARFLESLAAMTIEANKGDFEKWFSGDTKQNTLFDNINQLATSMSGLVTAFPGISEEGNTVKEDVEEVVGIIKDIAQLITDISDPNNYTLDTPAMDNITSATTNVFNLLLGYITSMSQTIHTFMQDTKDFDVERFKDFINPIVGLGNVLTSIGTGETDGSMDGLNSLLGDFTTTISGFLEGLNVEEINTKAAELDAAIQNIRNILFGGGENGEEGGTTTGLLGGLSSEDVSTTISSFATSLGDSASSLSSVGSELGSAVSSGMGTDVDTSGVNTLCSTLVNAANSYYQSFYNVGWNFGQGVASGISSRNWIVESAARRIIRNAISAMKAEADEHSPSKETERIARFMGMGLVNGFKGYSKVVNRAAEGVAGGALDTTRNTLANLSTVLSEDMDTTPVIRPVMDMSNVSAGARTINGIFSGGRTLSVGVTAAKAQAASASMRESKRRQNGTEGGGSNVSNSNDSSVNLTGNNFYVRSDQDVRALASEIAALTRQQQRSYGAAF